MFLEVAGKFPKYLLRFTNLFKYRRAHDTSVSVDTSPTEMLRNSQSLMIHICKVDKNLLFTLLSRYLSLALISHNIVYIPFTFLLL